MEITKSSAGTLNQQAVSKYLLTNQQGTRVAVLTWGATLQEFSVVEDGEKHNLIMNRPNLKDYDHNSFYLCQTLGRVAGRIAGAQFDLDGKTVHLDANEKPNASHGGPHGFTFVNWDATTKQTEDTASVVLTHTATEAEDKYPGTIKTTVTFTLTEENRLDITFDAESDAATLFNPTVHTYFNVTDDQHSLDDQWVKLSGDKRLVLNQEKIPTGEMVKTAGTGYNFSQPRTVKDGLTQLNQDGHVEYDDAFVVVPSKDQPIAEIGDTTGHREVQVYSDRNALVVFTANVTDADRMAKHDYNALAMEAQTLPDAIHHADFGDVVLPANQPVQHTISYQYLRK